jgi:capsular polysaccharide transport system permease protein
MTTTPKALNYHTAVPGGAAPARSGAAAVLAAIEAEGLSGRQLRLARRNAQKHGLEPASDIDAVRLLRARGLDPFAPSRVMDLVVSNDGGGTPTANLPAKRPGGTPPAPAGGADLEPDARAREIRRMQRDIARRRRLRMALLAVRLSVFILLPTAVAGWYFYRIATPLYATEAALVVESPGSGGGGGGGGILGGIAQATAGGGLAAGADAIKVQAYMEGRDVLARLDAEHGFRAAFSGADIDPLLRLPPEATREDVFALYRRMVKTGFDPTEGILRMEVAAPDPRTAAAWARALIAYAEAHVDTLSDPIRAAQVTDAADAHAEAEAAVAEAQHAVIALKQQRGVISAEAEVSAQMSRIAQMESQLNAEELELRQLLDNAEPNAARVNATLSQIDRLQQMIAEARRGLTEAEGGGPSLARISAELAIAEAELAFRQEMRAQALQQLVAARQEASRQARYLLTVEPPVATDAPAYPRAFENTLLALLIFAGIYLVISLTASILREQVAN